MALVDYSSSSDDDAEPPPAKRRMNSASRGDSSSRSSPSTEAASELPPLPPAFHDLYASTVRQSTVDDPSLHAGRKRQTPHVVGNWPSHLYVEWHPTKAQHEVLAELIRQVRGHLDEAAELHDFLTSDLGAPLPLHISLSRPLSLATAVKDEYLEKVTDTIQHSGVGIFHVHPCRLAWYRSPDSNRSFLVMGVASKASNTSAKPEASANRELVGLLSRCNAVAKRFGQPPLYQNSEDQAVGDAFHVSVGWSFEPPDGEKTIRSLGVFDQPQFADMPSWEIEVSGIKAKIGNVVSHIPLRGGKSTNMQGSLFGL